MGWLQRMFGQEAEEQAQEFESVAPVFDAPEPSEENAEIPPERLGIDGGYDQSGLAKRVALAFDRDPDTDDIDTIWVAQTSGTVVLKGRVPRLDDLDRLVEIAGNVHGATDVVADEVEVEA
jgi:osmotically-inducible protein OsmY